MFQMSTIELQLKFQYEDLNSLVLELAHDEQYDYAGR